MSLDNFIAMHPRAAVARRAIFLTCYMTGSTEGHNLGMAGYSHDFVARLFMPLLEQWGEVMAVPNPQQELEPAVQKALAEGKQPLHFSILPFQDVCLAKGAVNIVVPAWEFPDVPNNGFDNNPQNNWPATADRCDLVLVSGPFTHDALRKGGASVPIRTVPVPTPDEYFQIPLWEPEQIKTVDCRAFVFPQAAPAPTAETLASALVKQGKRFGRAVKRTVRKAGQLLLGASRYDSLSRAIRDRKHARQRMAASCTPPAQLVLPYESVSSLELSGIVYTSIFNPDDGRKNWPDLLTGFLLALGDREDATLVMKLITRRPKSVERLVNYYRHIDIPHRCRLAFVCDFLPEVQMQQLAEATTFYVQTTRAEGNCLPLMNYMAAGRPGVSPAHSSMGDYFDGKLGFVIDSHEEPCAWPHDSRLRIRSTWGRIVWTSLRDQLQASYKLAKEDATGYARLAKRNRNWMHRWASYDAVASQLNLALEDLTQGRLHDLEDHREDGATVLSYKAA
jgi:hypothetical protein